ncbi:quinate repressor [Curvularia clavata]|uniref:Quinate repressor n=1 Tax=Curvularia clavata TaxID=95742 RepID=A0A9Q8ZEV4_CURCL|nr:quinate repressor [Curvularia clavata]
MASVTVGTKRSFATMEADSRARDGRASLPTPSPPVCKQRSQPNSARSTPGPPQYEPQRVFDPRASIVLIGMHGTGKATLAMMASVTCQRRVIDMESVFHTATGFSTAAYRKQFGSSNRSLRQDEVLRDVLHTYDKGAIIVCSGSFHLDNNCQSLLREFSVSHPVIHITRDSRSVREYLETDEAKVRELIAISTPVFRRCSNYEFYNVSEKDASHLSVAPAYQRSVPAFLTLKRAERTFFKFLALILSPRNKDHGIKSDVPTLDPGHFPLSSVDLELRSYTCAVQVQLSDLTSEDVDIEELEFGCDAFEIVVEPKQLTAEHAENISKSMSKVRRSTVTPIIYHVMPTSTNSAYSTASYLACLWHGLRMAPEFMTIDLTMDEELIQAVVASRGSTKIIGHLHAAMDWYDVFWLEKYDTAMRLGCSVVRFTRPANFMDDNAAIQSFRNTIYAKSQRIPMICYNTGRAGRRSACFNQVLTPVIPEKLRKSETFAERTRANPETSWLTVTEATHILYASFTYDPMQFYIIGAAVGYSLSPAMHNAAYRACAMPHRFDRVVTLELDDKIQQLLRQPNFGGTAVSQPFKVEAIALTHSVSKHAQAIGAINTLLPIRHLNADGSVPDAESYELFQERNQSGPVRALYGDNTDWIGIRSCIRRGLSPANAVRPAVTSALVIGAGGMARAAIYAMLHLGIKNIAIFNRTIENAQKLVTYFSSLAASPAAAKLFPSFVQNSQPTFRILASRESAWPKDFRAATVIVSCIPTHSVGDEPSPEFTLPTHWMQSPSGGVVIELAYRTLNTPLTKQVREEALASWICLDGLDLLPEQGFAQFELFTGKRAPRRIMREEVLRCWTDEQGQSNPSMVQTRLEAIEEQEP